MAEYARPFPIPPGEGRRLTARPILGLIGKKRSGKDTFAARLVEKHGFVRYAFADALRRAALALDPIVVPLHTASLSYRLFEVVHEKGWEKAKEIPEVRRTLQRYGVAIRDIDPDFWVRVVMREVAQETRPVVITDVRFANEADAVETYTAGRLIRITRPGLPKEEDEHISETALDGRRTWGEVNNGSTVEDLHEAADWVVRVAAAE